MIPVPAPAQILHWLGGPVDIRVEIEAGLEGSPVGLWGSAEWDIDVWGASDLEWTDVTGFVFDVGIRAGATRWGERFESASCSITVDNSEGVWTPDSGVDIFHKEFRPGRKVRIVAIPDVETGTRVALFTGQVDQLTDLYADAGHAIATVINCLDFQSVLEAFNPVMLETPTGVQSTDERVHAALNRLDWPPGDRDIQAGVHNVQTSHLAQSTLEECARAADAEGGAFFLNAEGVAVFKARDWLTTDTRSTVVQGYLGYDSVPAGARAAHILGVATSHEAARIKNHVTMSRSGGEAQTVEDIDSQALHRRRTFQRMDFDNTSDAEVLALAERYLAAYMTDRKRIDSVTIAASDDPVSNAILWDTQFGDRLAVKIQTGRGWSLEKEVHVFSVDHRITADDWVLTLTLDDAQTFEGV